MFPTSCVRVCANGGTGATTIDGIKILTSFANNDKPMSMGETFDGIKRIQI